MARRKVRLQFIESMSARKSAYRKRKKGFTKKMNELGILCDVKAAAVIYSPLETEPVVIPDHQTAVELFTEWRDLPDMEKMKRTMTHEMYLRQRIEKMREQIRKIRRENKEKEITNTMYEALDEWKLDNIYKLDQNDVNELKDTIERYIYQTRRIRQNATVQEGQENQTAADPAAMELGLTTQTPFGEGTSRGVQQQTEEVAEPAAMELGMTRWTPFGEGSSRAFEQQTQQQQQEEQQMVVQPTSMELGLTTTTPFGEGSSRGRDQTQKQGQYEAAMEAQNMEQSRFELMQFLAQREQQQQQQHQMMFQQQNSIAHQQQQQQMMFPQQQNAWFSNIINPPTPPQTMDFLQPLPPLQPGAFRDDYVSNASATRLYTPMPPGTFGDHNSSSNDNATWPDNSSFRFP